MKKKIVGIVSASIIALALLTIGVLLILKQRNIEETGNVLRVEWYDQDGVEFTITTKEQLYEFARLSDFYDFSKQTIKLGADIVINEGNAKDWAEKAPEERWNPISGFAGRFDGQGHTISGLYGRGLNTPMALFTKTARTCVIQDVKLINSYFETSGNSGTASFISNGGGKLVKLYSNAIIDCQGESSAGIASNITEQSTLEECWYDGMITTTNRECGGLIDAIFGSRVTMKHCLFSGEITNTYGFSESRTGGTRTGGLIGRVDGTSTLILNDSLSNGIINETVNSQTGAFIGLAHGGADIQINDVYLSMDSYQKAYGTTGATSSTTGAPLWIQADSLKGTEAYRYTTLDFSKYWATSSDAPILRYFAEEVSSVEGIEKAYDISWYDKLSMNNLIMDEKDLYGMYILSGMTDFTDSTVKLGADIVYNEGKVTSWETDAPERMWYPINSFSGTFDGQGHSISGIYINWNIEASHCGLFGVSNRTSQIKNFSLKNSYITCSVNNSQTAVGSITGTTQGRVESVYSDAIIHANNSGIGGIVGSANGNVAKVVSNCWFDGEIVGGEKSRYQGGIVAYTSAGTLTIEHCLNSGNITTNVETAGPNAGGFLGMVNGGDGITIKDSLNVGTVTTNGATNNAGATIGYIQKERVATITDVYNIMEAHKKDIGFQNGILKGAIFTQKIDNMKGNGGYTKTTLDFKNYWSIVKDSTPILKTFAVSSPSVAGLKREIDVSWYDAEKDTYTLKTPEQFRAFAIMADTVYFKNKTVKLGADITFNQGNAAAWGENLPADVWTPIKRFDGTFDGQGHTISGIYVKREDAGHAGLFGMAFGDIKNLRLTNSYICHTETESGDSLVGSIVGVSRGNITNVYSDAIVVSHTKKYSGGIVGIMNADTDKIVSNVWFNGSLTLGESSSYGGGIVGFTNGGTLKIEHCLNSGTITTNQKTSGPNTGGILGGTAKGTDGVEISDCLNVGMVVASEGTKTNNIGSVVGLIAAKTKVTITNTYASSESHKKTIGINNKGTQKGVAIQVAADKLMGYGGYQYTSLDFDKYWAVALEPNGTPVLKSFGGTVPEAAKRYIDTSWYQADATTYEIKTAEQLYTFALISESDNFANKIVKLNADNKMIQMPNKGEASEWAKNPPEMEWKPIQNFAGTFEGNSNTISGIYINTDSVRYVGLFGMVTGDIQNLSLTNSYICGEEVQEAEGEKQVADTYVGSIAGVAKGNVKNVYSDAIIDASNKEGAGGIAGLVNGSKDKVFSNCWYAGTLTMGEDSQFDGGLIGYASEGTLTIEHSLFSGTLTTSNTAGTGAGGLLGRIGGSNQKVTIIDSVSAGVLDEVDKNTEDDKKPATNNKGSVIGLISKGKVAEFVDTYATSEAYNKSIGFNNGGTVTNMVCRLLEKDLIGDMACKTTTLDYADTWTYVKDGTPELQWKSGKAEENMNSIDKLIDLSWCFASEIVGDKVTYTIETEEQLYGLSYLQESEVFKGQVVQLDAKHDIFTMNKGTVSSKSNGKQLQNWRPVQNFAGTFEGNGNTISGIYINTDSVRYVGLFGMVTGDIQNLSLTNSYICGEEVQEAEGEKQVADTYVGSIAGVAKGNVKNVYSDAIIDASNKEGAGGIAGLVNGSKDKVFSNCWYAGTLTMGEDSQFDGGLIGYASEGTLTIEHSLFSGTLTTSNTAGTGAGGLLGRIGGSNQKVTIIDSVSAGVLNEEDMNTADDKKPATNNKGSVIGLISKGKAVEFVDTYATSEAYNKSIGLNNGGTVTNMVCRLLAKDLTGDMACKTTTLDYADTWTYVKEGTPELQWKSGKAEENMDSIDKLIDLSWCFEAENEGDKTTYTIKTEKQLYGLSYLQESGLFKGQVVKLDAEDNKFTMNEGTVSSSSDSTGLRNWRPIQNFAGTFEGQKNTINGIYMTDMTTNAGIFGKTVSGAVIQNFIVENSYMESDSTDGNTSSIGSVAGNAVSTEIEKVYVKDSVSMKSPGFVGGIVGLASGSTIKGCWFDGTIDSTSYGTGGMVGRVLNTTLTIEDCLFSGTLTSTKSQVGGMCGNLTASSNDIKILGCLNTGTMTGSGDVDYMVGWTNATTNVTWKDNYAVAVSTIATNDGVCGLLTADLKGENAYKTTTLDFQNTWKYVEGKTPELRYFSGAPTVEKDYSQKDIDLSWCFAPNEAGEYVIKTEAQLYGLSYLQDKSLFAGKVVKLDAEDNVFTMNEGTVSSSSDSTGLRNWRPIQNFAGTFKGNGETITGLYCSTTTANTGLFGTTTLTSNIQDFRLTNSYITSTKDAIGSVVGWNKGSVSKVYSEAEIKGVNNCGGIVGLVDFEDTSNTTKESVISYCWYNNDLTASGIHAGGIIGSIARKGSKASIEHCLNTGDIKSTAGSNGRVGGLCGNVNLATCTLNIEDSLHVGSVAGTAGTVIGSGIGRIASGATVTINDVYVIAASGVSNVGEGVATSGMVCGLPQSDLTGENAYKTTTLDFQNTWKYVEGKTPELRYFSGAPTVEKDYSQKDIDLSWCFAPNEAGEYVIKTEAQLYGLSYLQDKSLFAGKVVKLNAEDGVFEMNTGNANDWANGSIPDTVRKWRPIQNFAGTFNGNKNTVKGICYNGTGSNIGFFGTTGSCTITNMRLENSCFVTTAFPVGSIGGNVSEKSSFSKLYSDAFVKGAHNSGGILGSLNNNADETTISECWFQGSVTTSGNSAGGILGKNNQALKVEITNCLNGGAITAGGSAGRVAGICGDMNNNSGITINMSMNTGTITGSSKGTMVGYVSEKNCSLTIKNSYAVQVDGLNAVGTEKDGSSVTLESSYQPLSIAKLSGWLATANTNLQFDDPDKDGENDGIWIARTSSTPALRHFADAGLYADGSGIVVTTEKVDGKDIKVYTIDKMSELYAISKMVANGHTFKNEIVRLGASVTDNILKEGQTVKDWLEHPPANEWEPIGSNMSKTEVVPFEGTFDGQGFTIKGIYNKDTNHVGLFGYTQDSVIKNLNLEQSCFVATGNWVGSIAAWGSGTFERIYTDAYVQGGGVAGGLVGRVDVNPGTTGVSVISECWFAGTMSAMDLCSGGFVGRAQSANLLIEHSLVTGTVQSTKGRLGGFCGDVAKANDIVGNLRVRDCMMIPTEDSNVGENIIVGYIEGGSSSNIKTTYMLSAEMVKDTLAYDNTELQFDRPETTDVVEGSWVARVNYTPALKWKIDKGGMGTVADITG